MRSSKKSKTTTARRVRKGRPETQSTDRTRKLGMDTDDVPAIPAETWLKEMASAHGLTLVSRRRRLSVNSSRLVTMCKRTLLGRSDRRVGVSVAATVARKGVGCGSGEAACASLGTPWNRSPPSCHFGGVRSSEKSYRGGSSAYSRRSLLRALTKVGSYRALLQHRWMMRAARRARVRIQARACRRR